MKKRILFIFGTRPEGIKMLPVIQVLKQDQKHFEVAVCVTGQHCQMLESIMNLYCVVPDYDLKIMKSGQDLFDITSNVLVGLREVLNDFHPDIALVHGDTSTTFAASLACFYKNVRIAHVEAGLRTYNLKSPWPEEANRQLTDRIADYYFAPTEYAREQLLSEKANPESILVTGNTVIDALLDMVQRLKNDLNLRNLCLEQVKVAGYDLTLALKDSRKIVLITGHRRENFGAGIENICLAIQQLSEKFSDCDLVYPVHLNPNVQNPVKGLLSGIKNVYLIDPLDYASFVLLMDSCTLILTDSGGIQEEAPSLGKPVLVMRDTTERPEAVQAGTVRLVGTDRETIVREACELLLNKEAYRAMALVHNPYGDGQASKRIRDFLISEKCERDGCVK